ncbi:hypothetical protein BH09ACT6_BH09ACT6_03690 [soil metagenome]
MLLLFITSLAIIVYFWPRRSAGIGIGIGRTVVAPTIAAIGFGIALVLATQNAAFLVGGSEPAAIALVSLFYGLLVLGIVVALVLRRARPQAYARIGRQEL